MTTSGSWALRQRRRRSSRTALRLLTVEKRRRRPAKKREQMIGGASTHRMSLRRATERDWGARALFRHNQSTTRDPHLCIGDGPHASPKAPRVAGWRWGLRMAMGTATTTTGDAARCDADEPARAAQWIRATSLGDRRRL
uniref:Uncharacterized protein n=1 Tax=Plectus sambesii TaxID=2011161 RepID=A0A914V3U3_9BILA